MKKVYSTLLALMVSSPVISAIADEDITSRMVNGRDFYEQEQQRQQRDKWRDRSHDGRIKYDNNTSFGATGSRDPRTGETRGSINVRKQY